MLRGLAASAVLVLAWYVSGAGTVAGYVVVFWLVELVLDVMFVVFCRRLAGLVSDRPPESRFWNQLSVGGLFFVAGDGLQCGYATVRPGVGEATGESLPTVVVVIGIGCVIWALSRQPVRATGRQRLRWWLDVATIMIGTAAFMWATLWAGLGPTVSTHLVVVLLESGVLLVCAFGLIRLLVVGGAPFTRAAGSAAGVGAALIALGTAFGSVPTPPTRAEFSADMALRLLPQFLIAAAPRIQLVQIRHDPQVLARQPQRPYSRLPYLAVIATQLLLVDVLVDDGLSLRAYGVLVAAMLGTALVVGRQLVALADNARLLAELDQAIVMTRRQEHRFRSLVQHAWDLTLVADRNLIITYASPATMRVLGIPPQKAVGLDARSRVHPDDLSILDQAASILVAGPDTSQTVQVRVQHADDSWRWMEVIGTNRLSDPSISGIICNVRDVTQARQFQQRLRHEATHDSLTGLPNRAMFEERTRTDAADGTTAHRQVGILVVDLDDFKEINDTLGHSAGDTVLATVAERLLSCVRPNDTVARLGGDEFAVLLLATSAKHAKAVAARILDALSDPILIDNTHLPVRASIGLAVGRLTDADALLRASDKAMYEAKRGGKGTVRTVGGAPFVRGDQPCDTAGD